MSEVLPPPNELGGPDKFTSWRQEQIDAILRLTGSDKRFNCYNIPTGGGKSLISNMGGRLLGGRTLVLTANKALQNQILTDSLADADIRGQQNYECLAVRPGGPLSEYGNKYGNRVTVDRGPCHVGVHCWMKFNGCTYYDQVRVARETNGVVSGNYDYWLTLGKAIRDGHADERLGKFDLIVCDEAHAVVNKVCDALRIELPLNALHDMLRVKPLPVDRPLDTWRSWAERALLTWADEMDRLSAHLKNEYISDELIDEFKIMQDLGNGLEQVADLSGDWVIGRSWNQKNLTFDPVWPTDYTEQLLFRGAPKILFLSATITPKALDVIGVPDDTREYVEYPSSFPLKNRPVYILTGPSVPRVDFRMTEHDEWLWIELIDAFIGARLALGRKGIIHCVSYKRMERIKRLSKYRDYFITNSGSSETQEAVDQFKRSDLAVLLSPSVTTGEDFPDDECRWIVVAKLPFSDSRDPVAQQREKQDPGYGGYTMMITLAQSVGRGVRNKTDWCEAVVIDGHAKWALPKFRPHAPKYFRDSWRWVNTLPKPLEA